jgi:hypothetical protein
MDEFTNLKNRIFHSLIENDFMMYMFPEKLTRFPKEISKIEEDNIIYAVKRKYLNCNDEQKHELKTKYNYNTFNIYIDSLKYSQKIVTYKNICDDLNINIELYNQPINVKYHRLKYGNVGKKKASQNFISKTNGDITKLLPLIDFDDLSYMKYKDSVTANTARQLTLIIEKWKCYVNNNKQYINYEYGVLKKIIIHWKLLSDVEKRKCINY